MNAVTKLKLNPLHLLQQEFNLLELGGKFGVIRPSSLTWTPGMVIAPALQVYQGKDASIALKRFLETQPTPSKPDELIRQFYADPNTLTYTDVAFTPATVPRNTLNLWHSHTITAKFGNWHTIKQYLLHVLCSGDQTAYEYLIRYVAHALQRPEDKPGVMIVMLGGQGTGKGTLEVILRHIWEATTLMVSDVDSVIVGFNAQLERSYIVFMDEALFRGDSKSSDRLKSLVTSPIIQIEEKYQPKRTIESKHRFFAASNQTHFNRTEYDDRRMYYLRVSERFKGNSSYWTKLYQAIEAGEVEAMTFDLLAMDLTDFDVRQRPASNELLSQKIQSLTGFEKFWFDAVWNGCTYSIGQSGSKIESEWADPKFWQTEDMVQAYRVRFPSEQRFNSAMGRDVAEALKKLCPSAVSNRRSTQYERRHGYDLPALLVARQEMENYLGGKIVWPDL